MLSGFAFRTPATRTGLPERRTPEKAVPFSKTSPTPSPIGFTRRLQGFAPKRGRCDEGPEIGAQRAKTLAKRFWEVNSQFSFSTEFRSWSGKTLRVTGCGGGGFPDKFTRKQRAKKPKFFAAARCTPPPLTRQPPRGGGRAEPDSAAADRNRLRSRTRHVQQSGVARPPPSGGCRRQPTGGVHRAAHLSC